MQIGRERENSLKVIENKHISNECTAYNKRFGASGGLASRKCVQSLRVYRPYKYS